MLDKLYELFSKSSALKALEFIMSLLENLLSFFQETYFKDKISGKSEAIDAIIELLESYKKPKKQS